MIDFGSERETTDIDEQGSTLTVIRKIRNQDVMKTYKQFKVRIKVKDAKEETVEYLKHTDKIRQKRKEGVLLTNDRDDPSLAPFFMIDYPKSDVDGTYFVISAWTEVVA